MAVVRIAGVAVPEDVPASEPNGKRQTRRRLLNLLSIIVIAIVIVLAALLLTVYIVDDFNSLGELLAYIKAQY